MKTFLEVAMTLLSWSLGESADWTVEKSGQIYISDTEVTWCTVTPPEGDEFDWLQPEFDCGNQPSLESMMLDCEEDGEYNVYWRRKSTIMVDFKHEWFAAEEYGESWQTDTYVMTNGKLDRKVEQTP